jgi:hypothetical protein
MPPDDFADWTQELTGAVDLTLQTWDAVIGTFARGTRGTGWIFRGQENSQWSLLTRLQRVLQRHAPADGIMIDWENSAIGFFKRQVRVHLASLHADTDIVGWLALMQHYGAPTRLLDWTLSPFVACYFALAAESEAEYAAVWALNAYMCARRHPGTLWPMPFDHLGVRRHSVSDRDGNATVTTPALEVGEAERQNVWVRWVIQTESKWPLPVFPLAPDPRMIAQQSLLTCAGDLASPIDHLMNKDGWSETTPRPGHYGEGTDSTFWPLDRPAQVIRKFRLHRSMRREALESLQQMGITPAGLFPGLDGVGAATLLHMESGPTGVQDLLGGSPF